MKKPKIQSDQAVQLVTFVLGLGMVAYGFFNTDFKVEVSKTPLSALVLLAGLLLMLYPFIKYLKIGEYFEFSSKLADVQKKSDDLEKSNSEIKNILNTILISNQQFQAQ